MPIKGNGTDTYLELPARILTAYPCSELAYVSWDGSGQHFYMGQGSSTTPSLYSGVYYDSNGNKTLMERASAGSQCFVNKSGTPNPVAGSMTPCIAVYESASKRTLYFGTADTTGVTDTSTITNLFSQHDRTVIGALHFGGNAPTWFTKGSLAECHWYNVALTSSDVAAILAGAKPDEVPGWVDGLKLNIVEASGNYVSMTGTRTFVASGTWSASTLPHPVDRSGPPINLVGANLSQTATVTSGAVTVTPPSSGTVNLVGANLTQSATVSAGAVTVVPVGSGGTITHRQLVRNPHSATSSQAWSNETGLTIRYYSMTTGALVTSKTGWTTDSAGIPPPATDALLVAGTTYDVRYVLAGGARGSDILAAA